MATSKPKPRGRSGGARILSRLDMAGQLAAINRSQAVIELKLDGTILHANANFQKILGYSLEELAGQHHRMLLQPEYRDSADYVEFWSKLARGEFDAGRKKFLNKTGRVVWMRVSYNPIMDAKGRPMKVVAYAADITETIRVSKDYEGQLKAVSKAQAVVEFNLDGTVISANDNFLSMMGYTLEEILGKHHGMFVDASFRSSNEYRAFWEKLARGDYDAGAYRRIAGNGREVWIQASYNPILDMDDKPCKVVEYATDITVQRRQDEMNAAFKGALDNLSSNVMVADTNFDIIYANTALRQLMDAAQSDLRKDLPNFDPSRMIGASIDMFHRNPAYQRSTLGAATKTLSTESLIGGHTMHIVANPMLDGGGKRLGTVLEWTDRTVELEVEAQIKGLVEAAAAGDLTQRMNLAGKSGVFAEIGHGINQLTDNMSEVVSRVKAAANEVSRGADEISQGNTDLSQRTEEQASSLEETASSMEEMTSTVRQNADNASKASQLATAAREQADKGGSVVNQAIRAMTEINDASKKIVDIIGVIDEIAFQTNLLALNAAVEAARAGEQGRGFAVVASEVRSLAGRSATAAKEIKGLIQDSVKRVEQGSLLVTQSGQTLEHIVTSVKKVSDIIGEIAGASQEQSVGIEQVNKAVMQLDAMTQQNAALVEEASAASQSMAGQAKALHQMMEPYQVTAEAANNAAAAIAAAAETLRLASAGPVSAPANAERRATGRPWSASETKTAPPARNRPLKTAAANGNDSEWKEF
jgi:methyl-accepting chemotaxis protein